MFANKTKILRARWEMKSQVLELDFRSAAQGWGKV